jgi:hypothetical protein
VVPVLSPPAAGTGAPPTSRAMRAPRILTFAAVAIDRSHITSLLDMGFVTAR